MFRKGVLQPVIQLPSTPARIFPGAHSGLWICSYPAPGTDLRGSGRMFKFQEGRELEDHGPWPGQSPPLALFEERTGALWFGTAADGLFRLEGRHLESVPTSHHEVTCLTEDREGNLWAATTGGGLNLIRPRAVQLIGREAGLPFESVQSLCEDTKGALWAVSQSGDLMRGVEGTWEVISATTSWPGGRANCVAADREGGVWVGTVKNGVAHYADGRWRTWAQSEGLLGNSVRSLLVSADGDVWVGVTGGPERLMRIHDGQVSEIQRPGRIGAIRAMAETPDGTVWVGTSEGQLLRVTGSSLRFDPAIRERLTLSIRSLYATPDGSLWIGYAGDGLGRLKDGIHKRVTTAAGLMDNFVSQIQADGRDSLWLVGNRGLSRVQLSQLEAVMQGRMERVRSRIYGRSDGLPGLQPSRDHSPASCRTSDGRLWFSTRSGLLSVLPDKIADNLDPPPVRLQRVSVDDQPVAFFGAYALFQNSPAGNVLDLRASNPKLHIAPGHSKLEFEFAGLSYTSPENVQFRYHLKGFDQKWIEAGSERRATYPHLPGGNYEFQVLACNNAGVWNETGAVLSIQVAPYF
ncbi:MAG: ligand-binding sensor domain-containing protein, partial [Verrucomicrobiota bacterium]